jgi:hygromycin-B 7''-O-kinase
MSPLLPPLDLGAANPYPGDAAAFHPALREICARHALPYEAPEKFSGGSVPVFGVGRAHAVKLFPPQFRAAAATEAAVLAAAHGKLGVPTAGLVAPGELEGWGYVVMERLPGMVLQDVWEEVPGDARREMCRRVGAALARLHRLPVDGLEVPAPDWDEFVRRQAETCTRRQRERGLAEHWLEQIPGFLASVPLAPRRRVLLHTEVMRHHLLAQRRAGGWELTGLFDFEPAMVGDPEYELGSVGIFVTDGSPALFQAFLRGYGWDEAERGPALQRRTLAYTLLHRYSNLRWYLEVLPPRSAATLDELAAEWFPLA